MIPLRRPRREDALSPGLRALLDDLQAKANVASATKDVWRGLWAEFTGDPMYQELRDALLEITDGKCSYCEGSARIWEVDHHAPKLKFHEVMFDWQNLLVACKECNGIKRSTFPLIHPAAEDPGALLHWDRYGNPQLQDDLDETDEQRARRTINTLQLNHEDYCCRRKQVLLFATKALNDAEDAPSKAHTAALAKVLRPSATYRAILRQWFHHPLITARLTALEAAHPILTPTLKFYRDLGPPRPPVPTPPVV